MSALRETVSKIGLPPILPAEVGAWIRSNTARIDLLFPRSTDKRTLNFAEAFFHVEWKLVFEGREWRNLLDAL